MKQDYETEEIKEAAADVLSNYSKFVMACIGNKVRPCDMRLHLMKEISGMRTSLKRETSQTVASPDAMVCSRNKAAICVPRKVLTVQNLDLEGLFGDPGNLPAISDHLQNNTDIPSIIICSASDHVGIKSGAATLFTAI